MPIIITIETDPMRFKAYRTEDGMTRYLTWQQAMYWDNLLPFTTLFFYYGAHELLMEKVDEIFPPLGQVPENPVG